MIASSQARRPCVGGIVYNEAPYLLEWIAFHLVQGFEHFYIGDHDSDDGTTALLESLQTLGYVTRLFHPRLEQANAQTRIYTEIVQLARRSADLVAFIDADEYLVPTDPGDRAASVVCELLSSPANAAIGFNWRMFGSAGRIEPGEGALIQRFLTCNAPDAKINRHIKSAVKPECVATIAAHRATLLPGARYVNAAGEPRAYDKTSGFAREIPAIDGRVRIHHYVIKSYREFIERKARRGRATVGTTTLRGRGFFRNLDKDQHDSCFRALAFHAATQDRLVQLRGELATVNHGQRLFAVHTQLDEKRLSGQFLAEAPLPAPVLHLTRYGDGGQAEEQELELVAEPLELPAGRGRRLFESRPIVSGAGLVAYRFDTRVRSLLGASPLALRLRLHGHPQVLVDTRPSFTAPVNPVRDLSEEELRLQFIGALQTLDPHRASGWVRRHEDAQPLVVEVLSGQEVVTHAAADRFRADLLLNHKHPSGYASFDIDLKPFRLSRTAKLAVRVQGSGFTLDYE